MTSPGSMHTRDLTADDLDAAFDVRSRSFAPDLSMREWWNGIQLESIGAHRAIGVFEGEQLLGHAKIRPYQQFWGGRALPMGGVAGVVVAPDARGRGVGSTLMTAIARRSLELGDLVSALYPATIPLYRALGWEVAGTQQRISLSADALRTLGGRGVPLRKATETDVEPFLERLRDDYAARRASGPKLPSVAEAREQLTDQGMMAYVTDGGLVAYEWHQGDMALSYLSADTPEIARALWSVVGSGSSIAKKVVAHVAPDDPIHLLLPEEVAHESHVKRWMLRIMDVPKAIAARGFSSAVSGAASFTLDDPLLVGNSGSWRLEVAGGRGELTPTGATDDASAPGAARAASVAGPADTAASAHSADLSLRLGPNGFAALYAGTPVHVLRTAGLALGGDATGDALLDAAFAGRPAYLLEYF